MTLHQAELNNGCGNLRTAAKHSLLDIGVDFLSDRIVVFTPSGETIMALVAKAARAIGMVADTEAVLRVVSHNPDSLWAISRRTTYDARIPKGEGLVAFLMLNEQGLRQLAAGTFDAMNPNLALLTRQNEKPAAIYVWAVYAPGVLATGVRLVFEK